ncbi:phage tail tape measure protein, partial [Patescibacteria group bacterium]|nr:phage tail tape measure protein [Patescibacteria group bacterium]
MAKTFDLSVIFKAVDKFSAPMKKVGKAISRTVHPIKTVGRSLKQLAKDPSMKNLRKQAWYMSTSFKMSAERIKKDLKGVGAQFDRLRKDAGEFGKKMKSVGQDLSLKVTAPITLMGGLATKAAIDFETAFTGVRKTVDATEEEFGVLRKQLMGMALEIPLATTEIFGIAEAAGQLGIKQQDIGGFTKVMADLGATTNLSANEAASSLAKFANITKMSQKDMERLGSTIV